MTQQSTNLKLPYLAAGQAQKHVTVNETIRKLDAIVQITVESATTTAEPGAPSDGQTYIVPAGKTGSNWSGFTNNAIGYYRDGAWEQITPREGWLAFVRDTGALMVYDGSAWSTSDIRNGIGLGAAASPTFAGMSLSSASAFLPQPIILNTNDDANAGYLILRKMPASDYVRSGDTLGTFMFSGKDTGGSAQNAAWVSASAIADAGAGNVPTEIAVLTTAAGGSVDLRLTIGETVRVKGAFLPETDNTYGLGNGSFRFAEVFAGAGTINTSDACEKSPLRPLSPEEIRAVRRVMNGVGVFQWAAAIATKGAEAARLHCGVTAQDVHDAFAAEGLDATRYGLFCADPIEEQIEIAPARREIQRVATGEDGEHEDIEVYIPARQETRPLIDPETGAQMVRLGVRYDQLFAMALGALFRSSTKPCCGSD